VVPALRERVAQLLGGERRDGGGFETPLRGSSTT
jgi:hypothetical protein